MLATVLDGFLLIDAESRIRDVNAVYCQMTGFAREELLGRHITELDPIVTRQEIDNQLAKLVTAGRVRFESRHRCKSGVEIDVEINLSSPPSANGCFYCFVRDITERKRHELVLRIQRDVAARLSLTSDSRQVSPASWTSLSLSRASIPAAFTWSILKPAACNSACIAAWAASLLMP